MNKIEIATRLMAIKSRLRLDFPFQSEPRDILPFLAVLLTMLPIGFLLSYAYSNLVAGWVGALFVTGVAFSVANRYTEKYKFRMGQIGGPTWVVSINQIVIGKISDSDYSAIRYSVLTDARIYLKQLWSFAYHVSNRLIDIILRQVPIAVFWIVVLCGIVDAEILMNLSTMLTTSSPQELSEYMQDGLARGLRIALTLAILYEMMKLIWNSSNLLNIFNHYDDAIATKLRQRFGLAALGVIELYNQEEQSLLYFEERDKKAAMPLV